MHHEVVKQGKNFEWGRSVTSGYRSPVCGGEWAMCATRGHHHTPARSPNNVTRRDYIRHRVTHKSWHFAHKFACSEGYLNETNAFCSYLIRDLERISSMFFPSTAAAARAFSRTKPSSAGNIESVSPLHSSSRVSTEQPRGAGLETVSRPRKYFLTHN